MRVTFLVATELLLSGQKKNGMNEGRASDLQLL